MLAKDIVHEITGTVPKSFRAPYMAMTDRLWTVLSECGFEADSSCYSDAVPGGWISCGVTEVPVTRMPAGVGEAALSAYLWPMHEGKRRPESYLGMARYVPTEPFVIADHTWHIAESRKCGIRSPEDVRTALSNVREVLEGLMDLGYRPRTVSQLVASHAR